MSLYLELQRKHETAFAHYDMCADLWQRLLDSDAPADMVLSAAADMKAARMYAQGIFDAWQLVNEHQTRESA